MIDSMFHLGWKIAALPSPLDEWAAVIITSLFLVDGAKGITRRSSLARRRRDVLGIAHNNHLGAPVGWQLPEPIVFTRLRT